MSMQVLLSNQPASAVWGEKALISFNEDKATLHLTDFSDRTSIQKAARKLQNQGISDVALSGEGWQLESCWAFYQGFYNAKKQFKLQFPTLSDEQQRELGYRIQCGDFVREIINLPAAILTPEELAQRAAKFISQTADQSGKQSAVSFSRFFPFCAETISV